MKHPKHDNRSYRRRMRDYYHEMQAKVKNGEDPFSWNSAEEKRIFRILASDSPRREHELVACLCAMINRRRPVPSVPGAESPAAAL